MELEPLRKAANSKTVAAKLKNDGITVSEDAIYCTKCYNAHLALVTVDSYASTDHQLNAIILAQRDINTALAATLVLAGEQVLAKSAVLLVTLHAHFMHHAATVDGYASTDHQLKCHYPSTAGHEHGFSSNTRAGWRATTRKECKAIGHS